MVAASGVIGSVLLLATAAKLYGVLERQLAGRDYICDEYTIADMACWPWVEQYASHVGGLADYPAIQRWHRRIGDRPPVPRAMKLGVDQVVVRAGSPR